MMYNFRERKKHISQFFSSIIKLISTFISYTENSAHYTLVF